MSDQTALARIAEVPEAQDIIVRPAISVDEAIAQLQQIRDFRKRVLQEGVDYGIIPGTGKKPTLLKPGAEKLTQLFGFTVNFDVIDKVQDWEAGFFYYWYRCIIIHRASGHVIAHGDGSCNSKEDKYRYRVTPEWELRDLPEDERDKLIAKAAKQQVKNTKNGPAVFYYYYNTEPFSLVNTLKKMAQKRAMVAAVLIATRASEEFTQDVEDLGEYGGGEDYGAHVPPPVPPTQNQIDFLLRLMKSHVFSDNDRARAEEWVKSPDATKTSCSTKIQEVQKVIAEREEKNGDTEGNGGKRRSTSTKSEKNDSAPSKETPKSTEDDEKDEISVLHDELRDLFDDPDLPERSHEMWQEFYNGMRKKPRELSQADYIEELKRLKKNLKTAITKSRK